MMYKYFNQQKHNYAQELNDKMYSQFTAYLSDLLSILNEVNVSLYDNASHIIKIMKE